MRNHEFNLLLSKAVVTFFLPGPKGRKFGDGYVLPIFAFFLTTFKCKINNFIQLLNKIVMLQFCIQCTEIICRDILCIFSVIDLRELLNDRWRIFNYPEPVVIFIKITFPVKIDPDSSISTREPTSADILLWNNWSLLKPPKLTKYDTLWTLRSGAFCQVFSNWYN